jgi:hypothetical protein
VAGSSELGRERCVELGGADPIAAPASRGATRDLLKRGTADELTVRLGPQRMAAFARLGSERRSHGSASDGAEGAASAGREHCCSPSAAFGLCVDCYSCVSD